MTNEEKEMLLKLVFDRENDLFFWQHQASEYLGIPEKRLYEMLNELASSCDIKFESILSDVKYVRNISLTPSGLEHLYEKGLIPYFEYDPSTEYFYHVECEL